MNVNKKVKVRVRVGWCTRARDTHQQPTKIINYRSIIRWCLNEKVVSWGSERRARDPNLNLQPNGSIYKNNY